MSDPNFWRTEVWHPLTVHFPIALLLFATIFKLVSLFIRQTKDTFWQRTAAVMLYFGCLGAWVSIYTGDLADGIVSRNLCDPTVLKQHEIAAYNLAYLFSAATVLDLGQRLNLIRFKPKGIHLVVTLLMLVGIWFLIRAGHSGAEVVYEQAGGVLVPTADCAGF
ncbi:DUF2231 domain-containing protein [Pontibacter akesuensis]|uniref:Uncharacterized membrane protein n=1 Tax=Pontibacter akesuensis TaxID=388950 RepID=A0A1I7KWX2_9BACT|nr:DUF2231 domain-containing protein [Pontibacter akesuensis]GHA80571.1 hypothetical protein GCM10007389_38610 [Pontibacter akesuensis]SFV01804.1 Uncharacterized membrane protein [Pontibacter akesuensis]